MGVEQEDQLADHARQGVAEQLPHEDGRDDDAESERLRKHVEAIRAPDDDGGHVLAEGFDAGAHGDGLSATCSRCA